MPDPVDFVIQRGGSCGAGSIGGCLRAAADASVLHVDLSNGRWFEPLGIAAIAALAEHSVSAGRELVLTGPRDWSVANYLSRMRLGRLIEDLGGEHDLNSVREQELGDALLELHRFDGELGVERLAELVFNQLAPTDPDAAQALHTSIVEIGANVPQHSGAAGGYMAAQAFRDGRVQFAVADSGLGLFATLRHVGATSDENALELVLERGVSRTGEVGRGRGIREARRLSTEASGSVHMVSGLASRTAFRRTSSTHSSSYPYPGTLFQGTLHL